MSETIRTIAGFLAAMFIGGLFRDLYYQLFQKDVKEQKSEVGQ